MIMQYLINIDTTPGLSFKNLLLLLKSWIYSPSGCTSRTNIPYQACEIRFEASFVWIYPCLEVDAALTNIIIIRFWYLFWRGIYCLGCPSCCLFFCAAEDKVWYGDVVSVSCIISFQILVHIIVVFFFFFFTYSSFILLIYVWVEKMKAALLFAVSCLVLCASAQTLSERRVYVPTLFLFLATTF